MFKDVSDNHYAAGEIEIAHRLGFVNGKPDGTFGLGEPIKREDAVAMLMKSRRHAAGLVKTLAPSVVTIKGKRADGRGSLGSGVILDKQGYIATNVHVAMDGLDPWRTLEVYLDSMSVGLPAKALRGMFGQDIAIIKIDAAPGLLQPVELAQNPPELLDEVYCIGNPLGYVDTASKGVVSCAKRITNGWDWIQTDCAINPGNSGGGAFNFLGELVGLPTWIVCYADQDKAIPVTNLGFITPYWKVQELYQQALSGKVVFEGEPIKELIMFQI